MTPAKTTPNIFAEINRLRNRHIARVLDAIGSPDPHIVRAVKRGFSEIQQDFESILNTGFTGNAEQSKTKL